MSPAALGLALSLHGLAAAVLWWAVPLQPTEPPDQAIMVTVDAGAPPTSMDSPSEDKPAPPAAAGAPKPAPPEPPREEPQQALAEPQPPPPEQPPPQPAPPQPSLEQALAPPEELPPPTARDFPKPVRPAARAPPRPPQGVPSQAPPRPSPPAPAHPPANAPASVPGAPSNSSDWLVGKSPARNEYLSRVFRHIEPFRHYPDMARANRQQGRVVTRVVINRAGELLAISIERSSGWPLIDNAELAAIRSAMPLPPPPATMPGDSIALNLPYTYQPR